MLSIRFPGVRLAPSTAMPQFGSYGASWRTPTDRGRPSRGPSGQPPAKSGRGEADLTPPARISQQPSIASQLDLLRRTILELRRQHSSTPLEDLLRSKTHPKELLEAVLTDARSLSNKAMATRIGQIQQWDGVSSADMNALATLLRKAREEKLAADRQTV